MSISKRFAKYLLRNLSPEQQREVIQEKVGEVIAEESQAKLEEVLGNLGSISEEKVNVFFRSEQYTAMLKGSVEKALSAYMQGSYPILIIEKDKFTDYQKDNDLDGPIASVHGFGSSHDSKLEAENRALDVLVARARKQGANVVKILSKRWGKPFLGDVTYLIKGQLYVNNELPYLGRATGSDKPT